MSGAEQPCYTLINFPTDSEPYNEMQLKMDLEKGDIKKKTEALKKAISIILSGDKIPGLLMIIIRFVLPLQDHTIKKLLLIFWEIVPKTSADGKLLQEMILVCDAYRKDLQHPNEFIRGSTLRFLCKLKEPELLEPLLPPIRACLDHRHSYVRRNAVLAIFTIYRNFEFLIPDAPEIVAGMLESEQDMSCKRNAFLMLLHADQERALSYLSERLDLVAGFGDILQLVIVELIYKVCHARPAERPRFIRTVYGLLGAPSAAVRYEAAGTLVTVCAAPAAVKAAAACYIDLIVKESDNNVKLIVLTRLSALWAAGGEGAERALPALAMDVLRVLASSDLDVRSQTLDLALKLVSPRHAEELVSVLKREALKAAGGATAGEGGDASQYRQLLVRALHTASLKFPEVAGSVAPALIELVGEGSDPAAGDVLQLLREALHTFPDLQETIYTRLLAAAPAIRAPRCARAALWLLAQFASTPARADSFLQLMTEVLADLGTDPQEDKEGAAPAADAPRQLVTSDGTYASQSVFNLPQSNNSQTTKSPGLRHALLCGESFTVACACSALAKLSLKLRPTPAKANAALQLAAALLASYRQNFNAGAPSPYLTADDIEHCALCLLAAGVGAEGGGAGAAGGGVGGVGGVVGEALLEAPGRALQPLLAEARAELARIEDREPKTEKAVAVESGVSFPQLAGAAQATHDMFELSLERALDGRGGVGSGGAGASPKLSKVTQLTGFSDPVYAEAIVSVNQYDIVLDMLLVNQTDDTLQNCSVELATLGELRLVERPAALVLAPRAFATLQAHVKVASTENGVIFGNIVYEVAGASLDRGAVVLADVRVDIVDYIAPAACSDADFRRMWIEFEWENKVSVNTNITDLKEYLEHLLKSTNMKCLTPEKALSGQCGFMAANLYARSIFGEDALANLSLEQPLNKPGAPVVGHVRIRAKTQGMALSLGDKINLMQKATQPKAIPVGPAA